MARCNVVGLKNALLTLGKDEEQLQEFEDILMACAIIRSGGEFHRQNLHYTSGTGACSMSARGSFFFSWFPPHFPLLPCLWKCTSSRGIKYLSPVHALHLGSRIGSALAPRQLPSPKLSHRFSVFPPPHVSNGENKIFGGKSNRIWQGSNPRSLHPDITI